MEIPVELSRRRLLRTLAAIARRRALLDAEAAAWPLPAEITAHLQILELGLRPF